MLTIDGQGLKRFIINGARMLLENRSKVDAMNVFPVPDGDTGTNMSMTIESAAKAVEKLDTNNVSEVAKAVSNGALRGARGNSGVILSQILRGFYKAAEGREELDCDELALAFTRASEEAYRAVMKPKEGTMLTVIRAMGEKAVEASNNTEDIEEMLKSILEYAQEVLNKTPDMLPQLKQAGVVDSGGQGLVYIIRGGYENMGVDSNLDNVAITKPTATAAAGLSGAAAVQGEIKFGYCTEFFVTGDKITDEKVEQLRGTLEANGDSIVLVRDDELVKVHVHTNHPGMMLEKALELGSLESIKVENMRLQHTSLVENAAKEKPQERKQQAFIAVANGEGIAEQFRELGVDYIISGGQTMNPSTEDMLEAVEKVNADNVYILPNNKNIVMVANQAKEMCDKSNIIVIPTISIPQGMAAMLGFMPDNTAEENAEAMTEAYSEVATGEVTVAVRDTVVNDIEIKNGEYLGLLNDDIVLTKADNQSCTKALIDKLLQGNDEVYSLTVIYGKDVTEEEAEEIMAYVEEEYEDVDAELIKGGQDVYSYILGAE